MLISAVFILFIIPLSSVQGTLSEKKNSTTKSTDYAISSNVPKLVTALLNIKIKNQTHLTSLKPSSVNQTLQSTAKPPVDGDKKHMPLKNTTKSKAHTSSHNASKPSTTSLNRKVKMQTQSASSKTISINQTPSSTSKPVANTVSLHFSKPVTTLLKTKIKNQTNPTPLTISNVNQTLSSSLKLAVDVDQKHAPSSENKNNTTKSTANTINLDASKPVTTLLNKLKNQTQSDSSKTINFTHTQKPSIDDNQKHLTSSKRKNTTKLTANTSLNVSKTGPVLNTKVENQTQTVSSKTITVSQTLSSSETPAVDGDQNVPNSDRKNTTKSTANTSLNVSKTGPVNTKVKNQTPTVSSKTITVSQTLSSSETPAVDGDQNVPTSDRKNTTKSTANTSLNVSKTGPVLNTKVKNQTPTVSSKTITVSQTLSSSETPAVDGDQNVPTSDRKNTTKSTANTSLNVSKTGPVLNTKVKNQTPTVSSKTITVSQTLSSSETPAVDGDQNVPTSDRKNTTKSTANTSLNVSKTGPVLNTKVKNQTPTVSSKTITVSQTLLSSETLAVDGDQNVPTSKKKNTTKSTANTSLNVSKTGPVNTKVKNQTPTVSSQTVTVSQTLSSSETPAVDGDQNVHTSKRKNTTKSIANSSLNVSKTGPVLNIKVKNQTPTVSSKTITVSQTLSSSATSAVDGDQKHAPSSERKNTTKSTANTSLNVSKTGPVNTKVKNQTPTVSSKTITVSQTLSSSKTPAVDGDQKHVPFSERKNTTKSTVNTSLNVSKPVPVLNTKVKNQTQTVSSKTITVSQTLLSSATLVVDGDQKHAPSFQGTSSEEKKNTTTNSKAHPDSLNVSKPLTTSLNNKAKIQTSSKTISVNQTLTSKPAVGGGDQKHVSVSEKKNTTKSMTNSSNVNISKPVINKQTPSASSDNQSPPLSSKPTVDGVQKHVPSNKSKNKSTVNTINVNASKPVTTLLNNKLKNQTQSTSSKILSISQTQPSSLPAVDGDQKHIPSLQGAEKKNTTTKSTHNNVTLDVSKPLTTLLNTKTTKQSHTTSSKSKVNQTLPSSTKAAVVDVHQPPKDKPAVSSPIKVVITEGCVQKEAQTDSSNTTKTQETELSLELGSPLVMTHHIKLVPGTCTGGCETEMTALRDRVEFLEKEMSTLKKMCIQCSEEQCPKNCSGQGKCEGGKCVCHQGFSGPDCSSTTCPSNCNKKGKCVTGKCVCQTGYTGPECSKGIDKIAVTVETVTMKTSTTNNSARPEVTSVMAKPDKTIFVKRIETKDIRAKPSPTASTIKTNVVKAQSNTTRSDKVILTVGQALLKLKEESRQQQATKGKTTVIKMSLDKRPQTDLKLKTEENKESTDRSTSKKNKDLKDQPVNQNVTQSTGKKINGTSKVLVNLVKDTKGSSNGTTSRTKATTKTVDEGKANKPNGTSPEKEKKLSHGNVTTVLKVEKTSDKHANWTSIESKPHVKQFNRTSSRSSVIGSVEVRNITSTGFIMSWEAPLDTFKNFTVTRREIRPGNNVEDSEKIQDGAMKVSNSGATAEDITGVQNPGSTRIHGSKLDGRSVKKFSHVLPGTARSYHFKGLQPQTQYSVSLFGSGPGVRSKIHRLTLYTGPEPPSDLMFSNITETALTLSWMKPKSIVAEFKVTYTNTVTGDSGSMSVDSQLSHVLLSKLSAGTTYDITVRSLLETLESEPITASVTTVPDSPTELKVMNITDSKALLVWKPSQAKVDSYILSYGSTKSPNVTVTVTLSGSTVEHQLRSLQRSSLHMVKITSRVNRLQSRPISTTFTTGSGVKLQVVTPYEVTFHSAVISWKGPRVVFKSYRLTYQPTEEVKEVILNPSVTQYELTGLAAFTNYTVKIEGERDGLYLDFVSAEFTTAPLPNPYPTDCSEVQMNGVKDSGEVEIYPEGKDGEPVWVYCDMETDEGGWTVFQRRMDGSTDFFRNWRDYSKGFGLLTGEFWLGNDVLHTLTSLAPMSLRIDLRSGNDTAYAYYDNFNISSEADHYAIELSGYSGTAGDSMRYHNGRPFSTKDKDPDILSIHCAKAYMGGWWYKNCYKANLNGLYGSFSDNKGVVWIDWKGKDASLPFTEMKLRPSYLSQRALTTPTTQG